MLNFLDESRQAKMKREAKHRGEPKPDVAKIPDADLVKLLETGQERLSLMVLECTCFDSAFYHGLVHADATTPVPVKTAGRTYPNWAKFHAEEMATAAQGFNEADGGYDV